MFDASNMRRRIALAFINDWRVFALAVVGIILSIGSGFTTWMGLTQFTGVHLIWLSLLITIGLQTIMLVAAWLIARELWSGGKKRKGLADIGANFARVFLFLPLFFVPFIISVVFSAVSLFSSEIFSDAERTVAARNHVRNEVGERLGAIGAEIEEQQTRAHSEWRDGEAWQSFAAGMNTFTTLVAENEDSLRNYFTVVQVARDEDVASLRLDMSDSTARAQRAEARLATVNEELARDEPALQDARQRRDSLKREYEDLLQQAEAKKEEWEFEKSGTRGTGKKGCGPVCVGLQGEEREIRTEAAVVEGQLNTAIRQASVLETRVVNAQARRDALQAEMANAQGSAAAMDGQIEALSAIQSGIGAGVRQRTVISDGLDSLGRPAGLTPGIGRTISDTAGEDDTALDVVASQCREIMNLIDAIVLDQADPADRASLQTLKENADPAACDRTAAQSAALQARRLSEGLAVFRGERGERGNCEQLSEHEATSVDLIDHALICLEASGLAREYGGDFATKQREAFTILRIEHPFGVPDQPLHPFVRVKTAFLEYQVDSAYLALIIAIAIDSLVFISALIGAAALRRPLDEFDPNSAEGLRALAGANSQIYDTDSEDIMNRKAFLNALRPREPDDEDDDYRMLIDLDEIRDTDLSRRVNAVVVAGSRRLGRAAMVKPLSNSDDSRVYLVHRAYFEDLAKDIVDWERLHANQPRKKVRTLVVSASKDDAWQSGPIVSLREWVKDREDEFGA